MPNISKNTDVLDGTPNDGHGKCPSQTADTVREIRGMIENGLKNGAEYVAGLEARIRALESENAELRKILETNDSEIQSKAVLARLEAEVADMLSSEKPPEFYGERADKKESPIEFLKRVYGRYSEKGKEAIYLDEIRKLDPKFVNVLSVTCNKTGVDVSSLVPLRTDRTERVMKKIMEDVGGTVTAKATKAVHAVKMRKWRKAR